MSKHGLTLRCNLLTLMLLTNHLEDLSDQFFSDNPVETNPSGFDFSPTPDKAVMSQSALGLKDYSILTIYLKVF